VKEHKEQIATSLNLKSQISKPVLCLAQRQKGMTVVLKNNYGDVASKKGFQTFEWPASIHGLKKFQPGFHKLIFQKIPKL
jgi:hypothetical protein